MIIVIGYICTTIVGLIVVAIVAGLLIDKKFGLGIPSVGEEIDAKADAWHRR
jgi:hypothetical protein